MKLGYIEPRELARIRAAGAEPVERAAAFADACRINILYGHGAGPRGRSSQLLPST